MGFFDDLADILGHLSPLLIGGCAIVAILKLPGTASRVLCGIGLGLMGLRSFLFTMAGLTGEPGFITWIPGPMHTFNWLTSWALIFVGLLLVRRATNEAAVQTDSWAGDQADPPGTPSWEQQPADPHTAQLAPVRPHAVSDARPGWGLLTAWIILSSLSFLLGLVIIAMLVGAGSRISDREMGEILVVCALSFLVMIPGTIVYLIWLYKTWAAVPEQYRSTTPGQAVGFLFIPIFNYYWVFRAIPGLSASIQRARLARNALHPSQVGGTGFGVGVVACIVALIPYVGVIAWPFFLIWAILANAGKNRMLEDLQS